MNIFNYPKSKIILKSAGVVVALFLILVAINTFGVSVKNQLTKYSVNKEKNNIPPATNYNQNGSDIQILEQNSIDIENTDENIEEEIIILPEENESDTKNTANIEVAIPESVNLNVPFISQAPTGNWDLPFKEACEEVSLLMVDQFYQGTSFANTAESEKAVKKLTDFVEKDLELAVDTDAKETASVMEKYFGYKNVRVVYDITIEDIKKELAQGNPVIIPAAGRMLGNPYYRPPGPPYHMLVVKGYTKTKFITNDPGTRHGKDFTYNFDTLYNAIHDWNNGNVDQGKKVMIVVEAK